ncbi:MAG: HIRAN domain-containing protein [Treponema sp.]|jgi:hypothetical protein|nr:HIRAN domain-containing protein [Treponema sp.]
MTEYEGVSLDNRWSHLQDIRAVRKKNSAKSKACRIANKIPRTMSRSEAFTTAWKIVKTGCLELSVKGVTFGNRQEALRRLATYDPSQVRAWLVPEPENPADPAAVAVMVGVQNGRGLYCLGYLPREQTALASVFRTVSVRVLDGDIRGARIALGAYVAKCYRRLIAAIVRQAIKDRAAWFLESPEKKRLSGA